MKEASYEFTDASVDRQIVQLKATGCDALIAATVLQFAVQTIQKVHDLGWKPIFFMNNISASVPLILEPAGLEPVSGYCPRPMPRARLTLRSRMTQA